MKINWSELAKAEGYFNTPLEPKRVVPRKDSKAPPEEILFDHDNDKLYAGYRKREFRRSKTYPDYYISEKGIVKNIDGQTLRRPVSCSDLQIGIRIGDKTKNIYKHVMLHESWPEIAPQEFKGYFMYKDEAWKYIQEYPGYAVSTSGVVIRLKNYTIMTNRDGRVYMSKNGKATSKTYRKLTLAEFKHYPGELIALKEHPGYAISKYNRVYNLSNMGEITQHDGRCYTKSNGKDVYINVKQKMELYFP